MEPQVDNVTNVSGLTTSTDQYGVFYPYDNLLVISTNRVEAEDDIEAAARSTSVYFKDAYMVKVSIERVEV